MTCALSPFAIYQIQKKTLLSPTIIPLRLVSHLNPPQPRAAAAAIYKYPLARLEIRVLYEACPTGETCKPHGPRGFKA